MTGAEGTPTVGSVKIVTVTPNPSLDLTYTLRADQSDAAEVMRAAGSTLEASGKGVNVSRALHAVGVPTCAVLPVGGRTGRFLTDLLADDGVPHRVTRQAGETRVNVTALRPGERTVKLNGPGSVMSREEMDDLVGAVDRALADALADRGPDEATEPGRVWLAIAGSLPPGAGPDLVTRLVRAAHARGASCAVDAAGPALSAALDARANLLCPNRFELADICPDVAPEDEPARVGDLARRLAASAGVSLLVSAGAQGALYTDGTTVLHGWAAPLTPVNTAGAGDALLAGWLAACGTPSQRLANAMAWGRSACLSATTVDPEPGARGGGPIEIFDLTPALPASP